MTSHSPVFPLTPYLCRWIVIAGSREENSVIYGVEQHCIRISTDWSWKLGQDLHMSFGLKFWYYKFKRFSQSSNMNYQLPCFMALYIPLSQDSDGNLFRLRNKHEEHCLTGTPLYKCCLIETRLMEATRLVCWGSFVFLFCFYQSGDQEKTGKYIQIKTAPNKPQS